MRLSELICNLPVTSLSPTRDIEIHDIADDSRRAGAGCLFIVRGPISDAKLIYAQDALKRGAVALLGEDEVIAALQNQMAPSGSKALLLCADKVDQAIAGKLTEKFFDYPSRKLKLIGITGTNGKTTIGYILRHLLNSTGLKTGLIGTVEIDYGDEVKTAHITTPGAVEFSHLLDKMVKNGCAAAVTEVSSHALDQGRAGALDFDGAIFTNLSGDHMDYHGSLANYARAKAKLFEQLNADGFAVLNCDDKWSKRMAENCQAQKIWTALQDIGRAAPKPASLGATGSLPASEIAQQTAKLSNITPVTLANALWTAHIKNLTAAGSQVVLQNGANNTTIDLPLVGRHNVSNALQALAGADALLGGRADLYLALQNCPAPPGRLEIIPNKKFPLPGVDDDGLWRRPTGAVLLPTVIVDYAHTHDALENVLTALRPLTGGKLIAVIGCGGDRDKSKRPKMAKVAVTLADYVYITSDNPRTEDPDDIIKDMLVGAAEKRASAVTVQVDRAVAIHSAVTQASENDCVLIAGKGHEDYQIIGSTKHHFDDREQAVVALAAR